MTEAISPRLAEIIEDFSYCEGSEKLEYLLEFAESLPALPPELQAASDSMEQVHECITPVFLHAEYDGSVMQFFFDVPAESPTVAGFAHILMQGFNGLTPEAVIAVPNNFYVATGLPKVLSGQRMAGMSSFLAYMKRQTQPHVAA